jgi:hypothetical protein
MVREITWRKAFEEKLSRRVFHGPFGACPTAPYS